MSSNGNNRMSSAATPRPLSSHTESSALLKEGEGGGDEQQQQPQTPTSGASSDNHVFDVPLHDDDNDDSDSDSCQTPPEYVEVEQAQKSFIAFLRVFAHRIQEANPKTLAFIASLIIMRLAGNMLLTICLNFWYSHLPKPTSEHRYSVVFGEIVGQWVVFTSLFVVYTILRRPNLTFLRDPMGYPWLAVTGMADSTNSFLTAYAADLCPEVLQALASSLMPINASILTKLVLLDPRQYLNRWVVTSFTLLVVGVVIAALPNFLQEDGSSSTSSSSSSGSSVSTAVRAAWSVIYLFSTVPNALQSVLMANYMMRYTDEGSATTTHIKEEDRAESVASLLSVHRQSSSSQETSVSSRHHYNSQTKRGSCSSTESSSTSSSRVSGGSTNRRRGRRSGGSSSSSGSGTGRRGSVASHHTTSHYSVASYRSSRSRRSHRYNKPYASEGSRWRERSEHFSRSNSYHLNRSSDQLNDGEAGVLASTASSSVTTATTTSAADGHGGHVSATADPLLDHESIGTSSTPSTSSNDRGERDGYGTGKNTASADSARITAKAIAESSPQHNVESGNNVDDPKQPTAATRNYKGDDTTVKVVLLAGDQTVQLLVAFIMMPVDAVPFWGGSASAQDAAANFSRGFSAIFTHPSTFVFFFLFVCGNTMTYTSGAYLSQYSATLSSLISQLGSPLTALALVIFPSWNAQKTYTPWFYSAIAAALLTVGTIIYSAWEEMSSKSLELEKEEYFEAQAEAEAEAAAAALRQPDSGEASC